MVKLGHDYTKERIVGKTIIPTVLHPFRAKLPPDHHQHLLRFDASINHVDFVEAVTLQIGRYLWPTESP